MGNEHKQQGDEQKQRKEEEKRLNLEIGCRLKEVRTNTKYTQEQFAEAMQVSVEQYRKIENGRYGLNPKKMEILNKKYRIDLNYLITGMRDGSPFYVEFYLANCDLTQRNEFIERVLLYMKNLMLNS